MNKDFYTVKEIAEKLSIYKETVYKLINRKELKAFKVAGRYRIKHIDFEEYIKNSEVRHEII